MPQYILEIRYQKSPRSRYGRFVRTRPDTYVAVQIVPEGIEPLLILREDIAKERGITIKYFGEGYRKHTGPRSMLGKAIEAANLYINNAIRMNNE